MGVHTRIAVGNYPKLAAMKRKAEKALIQEGYDLSHLPEVGEDQARVRDM